MGSNPMGATICATIPTAEENDSKSFKSQFESEVAHHHLIYQEELNMRIIESLENRIHILQQRDPIGNMRIINKLKRQIRAMAKN